MVGEEEGALSEKETEKEEGPVPLMQILSSPHGQGPWVIQGSRPPADWPQQGEVEFQNYSVRYRPGLELALKNLSLRVRGGEKVRAAWVCAWEVAILLEGAAGLGASRGSGPDVCLASLEECRRCPR